MDGSTAAFDRQCMTLALEEARKAAPEDDLAHAAVGAVAAINQTVLATAFRGETAPGEHAEYVLLERKLAAASLVGATVYTTLEPCTGHQHPKISCVERLVQRQVGRVFVGMLEPNPYLTGRGVLRLNEAGVGTEMFPGDLAAKAEGINAAFTRVLRRSVSPTRVHFSGYEWDLLETDGVVAGRSQQAWYEYFLATSDLVNLERLREFYALPAGQIVEAKAFDVMAAEPLRITVATDLRLIQSVTNDPRRLLSLTPREFERFTAELLERLGYVNVKVGRGSKDGGIDVAAYIAHPLGVERVIVQCKRHSRDHKVGEPIIKQLLADADIHHAARGLVVTTSYLTRNARLMVDTYRYRLSALDYDELSSILRGEDQTKVT